MVARLEIRPALSQRESPHERNRAVLYALSDDAKVVSIFDACGVQRGWWTANREWKRSYSRFHPDRLMFADLVFVSDQAPQALCRVELSCNPPSTTPANGFVVETDFGFARCTRFPEDPRLAGLREVAALGGVVTRYHPAQRCTLRVETEDRGTVFAKVYANREKAELMYDAAQSLWRAAARSELGFRIAEPLAWDPSTSTAWQSQLTGERASEKARSRDGDVFIARLARAAASLTRVNAAITRVTDGPNQLVRSIRNADELVSRVPSLQHLIAQIIVCLAETHASAERRPLHPIHGSLRLDHCFSDGASICIFDLDRFGSGDPEMDAGTFIQDLEFLQGAAHPSDCLSTCFLEGYEEIAGPLRRPLVTAYRAHARLGKALRAAQKVRPDGDTRAAQLAQEALQILRSPC